MISHGRQLACCLENHGSSLHTKKFLSGGISGRPTDLKELNTKFIYQQETNFVE